jgi:CDP-diacylglycerol--glycerol-3-phosphate 3-phosphatidyltransferase
MKFITTFIEYLYDQELLPLKRKNLANYITLVGSWISRISLYLFFLYFVYFFVADEALDLLRYLAIILSAIAAFSDLFDGYIARKNNCVTALGKIFDPHHDKIQYLAKTISLSMDAFIYYCLSGEIAFAIFAVVLCYITGERDETVGFHRQWASSISSKIELSARASGKWRTRLCFPGIIALHLLIAPLNAPAFYAAVSLLLIGVTLWSLYDYVHGYRKKIRAHLQLLCGRH